VTTVLITGAGGLIGARVAEAAGKAGYSVTRILRKAPPTENMLERDLRIPLENVPPCDWVFHLAGGYAGAGTRSLKRADLRIARNLVGWGIRNGVKNWVIASAAEVYGSLDGVGTEEAPTRPVIPYGEIKLAVERLFARMAVDMPGSRVVILRIGEVYGHESRLVDELATRLKRGLCPWPGSGRVPVSFVHVEDVAQAFLLAAERAPEAVSIYNVADGEPTTWRSFIRTFAGILDARPPIFLPRPLVYGYALGHQFMSRIACREPVLTRHALRLLTTPKALSNRKIVRGLGFAPRFPNSRSGLEETLHGLSHDTENGAAQRRESRVLA
jgi:nucleoside-diphosphate-sugar epimerase